MGSYLTSPTLQGYVNWVQNVMGVSTTYLPADSPYLEWTYNVALAQVNPDLAITPVYAFAVYNLGGSLLVNFAPDVSPPVLYMNGLGFFAYMRQKFNVYGYVPGTITSSSDVSTAQSMVVPKAMENFTLDDLQRVKDPWGRQYLAFAQKYGPNAWGAT